MKSQRQKAIMDLILREEIETQDEMTARLIALGYPVTQATVSRDIKDLRLIKSVGRNGRNRYVTNEGDRDVAQMRQLRIFVESVLSVDYADNLLILRTLPGSAQSAAGTLDDMHLPEVIGCIGGDDTVLVISRSGEEALTVRDRLETVLNGG